METLLTASKAPVIRPLSPADPRPRGFDIEIPLAAGEVIEARVDTYSDRLRCDHPAVADGLGEALKESAEEAARGRIVVLARAELAEELERAEFAREALIPGFYGGEEDCAVLGYSLDQQRAEPGFVAEVERVDALIQQGPQRPARRHPPVETERATVEDAEPIAELIADTFAQYPTPSGVPAYIEQAIEDGVPFRVVREDDKVIACASADLIREAKAAELTDCATRPSCRGRGLMQAILSDLMADLSELGYPTAFTLARARIPGVNLAFQRLGFEYRGRMTRSCRIGGGLEDMNVWSRRLAS